MDLYLDTETFSELELKKVGAYRYSEECEVLLLAYALDDEPVKVLDLTDPANARALEQLARDVEDADTVIIHNSAFDRQVLKAHGVDIPVEKIEDTMVTALRHSLPASLDELCDVMKVPFDKAKDKDGKKLIQLFCKPRPKNMKLRRATRETHPDEWQQFITYAGLDVDAMRYVRGELPRWNNSDSEQKLWRLDQKINDRGIAVDLGFARAALGGAERASRSLAAAIRGATGGAVESATQREKLLAYLRDACGYDPGDLKGGTIAALLKTDLDPKVRMLLTNRKQAAATSPAKYDVLLRAACHDRRLRGLLQYCGASRTGRWGGRLFQPQNLPRPALLWPDIEMGIDALLMGEETLLFDQPMELITSAIRSALVAEEGKKLVIADLSNIEGRMLAWMADEQWKIKAFREFDAGVGHDLYVLAYARSFGVSPEAVLDNKKNGDGKMRHVGKVMELACGYQGSVGAFNTMGALYGIVLPDDEALAIVKAWRKAHSSIVSFWYDLDRKVKQAVREPGKTIEHGPIRLRVDNHWLRLRLPSGRYLSYPGVAVHGGRCTECNGEGFITVEPSDDHPGAYVICDACEGKGRHPETIWYSGVNQYTRKWQRIQTYGGKLTENLVQAASRDVLAANMQTAEDAGYAICLHVHDELITETPDDPRFSSDELEAIMASNPAWSIGLPLAAGGYETHRYRKD